MNQPYDQLLAKGGQIHEGEVSTTLGMKGIPELSEILMLKRDLDLLAALSHQTNFAIGCYCEDESRCHRSILRELLEQRGANIC